MRINRRKFLSGFAFIMIGIGAVSFSSGLSKWLYLQLAEQFGDNLADSAVDQGFLEDYIEHLKTERPADYRLASLYLRIKPAPLSIMKESEADFRRHMTGLFLRSTNAVRVLESGEAFEYSGLFVPRINPCTNRLSSHFL